MNADTAKRIATERLPCKCGMNPAERLLHHSACPAYFRSDMSEALLEAARMPLFRSGDFTLHSGDKALWKIDCDVLTDADLETLAAYAVTKLKPFSVVVGVPTGGLRFAKALQKHATPDPGITLIADDVLTTGSSMEGKRVPHCQGVVIFARGPCPDWITPLFSCAARMPGREQMARTIYYEYGGGDLADGDFERGVFQPDIDLSYRIADALIAAWSKPQENPHDGFGN